MIETLICKGLDVLNTREPNPAHVIGYDQCDIQAFTSWKTQVLSFIGQSFGITSPYYTEFSIKVLKPYTNHIEIGLGVLNALKEELNIDSKTNEIAQVMNKPNNSVTKIFISHASADQKIVENILDLLESIGILQKQIFCSSFEGYGIPLGENFLERIKNELVSDVLVLFVITENFYASKVCLCEMGAAWALSRQHIPIVVPPLNYKDIQGVIPLTQGLLLNDFSKLNSLKEKLEEDFHLENKMTFSIWERKRNNFLKNIENLL